MRVEGLFRELRDIRAAYGARRAAPPRYELLLLPFYEHRGRFWSELLGVVERNPWTAARAVSLADVPARVLPPAPSATVPVSIRRASPNGSRRTRRLTSCSSSPTRC